MAMGDPMAGGEDPGMGGPEPDMGGQPGGEDDELAQIINGLSIEDKAAVLKYAKSMAGDGNEGNEQGMPMENTNAKTTIREDMMGDVTQPVRDRKTERDETKLSKKAKKSSPFVSPY